VAGVPTIISVGVDKNRENGVGTAVPKTKTEDEDADEMLGLGSLLRWVEHRRRGPGRVWVHAGTLGDLERGLHPHGIVFRRGSDPIELEYLPEGPLRPLAPLVPLGLQVWRTGVGETWAIGDPRDLGILQRDLEREARGR
jgi:hypothetical protein